MLQWLLLPRQTRAGRQNRISKPNSIRLRHSSNARPLAEEAIATLTPLTIGVLPTSRPLTSATLRTPLPTRQRLEARSLATGALPAQRPLLRLQRTARLPPSGVLPPVRPLVSRVLLTSRHLLSLQPAASLPSGVLPPARSPAPGVLPAPRSLTLAAWRLPTPVLRTTISYRTSLRHHWSHYYRYPFPAHRQCSLPTCNISKNLPTTPAWPVPSCSHPDVRIRRSIFLWYRPEVESVDSLDGRRGAGEVLDVNFREGLSTVWLLRYATVLTADL